MLIPLIKKKTPLIDLRAPVEFSSGAVPTSINLPILDDEERSIVGKTYKDMGNQAAKNIGYDLVSGRLKEERVTAWKNFVDNNPNSKLYCARGGERSKIAQSWLKEIGINIDRVDGGFKALRNACLDILNTASNDDKKWIIISGKTGSAKTKMISKLNNSIDLELLANHRGSAFGSYDTSQPTPIDFENNLAYNYLSILSNHIFFEDESRTIGRLVIPEKFYNKMSSSDIVLIEEEIDVRIENIYNEYVKKSLKNKSNEELSIHLRKKLAKISNRLGGVHYDQVDNLIKNAFEKNDKQTHYDWIEKLLLNYYDKMYDYQIEQKKDRCLQSGDWSEIFEFLSNYN
tara:strand:+ start:4151 stop:5182 length:1032 start_codon:yes stop_codon:yes gene_type:complete